MTDKFLILRWLKLLNDLQASAKANKANQLKN